MENDGLHFLANAATSLGTLVLVLLAAGVPFPGLPVLARLLGEAARQRTGRIALFLTVVVLSLNSIETSLDDRLSALLELDFTPKLYALEGDFVAAVQQRLAVAPLPDFWAWIYLFVYPAVLIAPVAALYHRQRHGEMRAYLSAAAFNYLAAIPFYLFFPVTEVGWSGWSSAAPLLERSWPSMVELLRTSSGLNNCFPSLHVSLSITAALCSLRSGERRLAAVTGTGAALIVLSTWALGVHWLLDAAAGLLLAAAAFRYGPALEPLFQRLVARRPRRALR